MKQIVVLFGVVAMGFAKFGLGGTPGKDYFYNLPLSKGQAIEMGWTQSKRPPSALPSLTMFCPVERSVCIMFDPVTECVAGLQVAVALNATTGMPYDWSIQGFVPWNPSLRDSNVSDHKTFPYMTKQVYFVTEESLSVSDEERRKNAGECKALQQDAVWVSGFNQKLIKVGTTTDGIDKAGFTMQKCYPGMGTHYLYKMSKTLKCSAETVLNWFMLVDSGKLIGFGFLVPARVSPVTGQRYYFERQTPQGVQSTMKEISDCFIKLSEDPTFTTIHMYFIDEPWTVPC